MKLSFCCFILAGSLLAGCSSGPATEAVAADYRIFTGDSDSIDCKIIHGDILATTVLTVDGDTLELNNDAIDRIISLRTGIEVTDRYIDREALTVELMKKEALEKREKLKADIAAGKKKKSELDRIPFAVLSAELERTNRGLPQVVLTILNLTNKKISLIKTRIYCFDQKGQPISGVKGRNHIFDASSRIPIGPGEDFTTTLVLRNHPKTKKATIEIHYLEFTDRTWWKGKVEETVD